MESFSYKREGDQRHGRKNVDWGASPLTTSIILVISSDMFWCAVSSTWALVGIYSKLMETKCHEGATKGFVGIKIRNTSKVAVAILS